MQLVGIEKMLRTIVAAVEKFAIIFTEFVGENQFGVLCMPTTFC